MNRLLSLAVRAAVALLPWRLRRPLMVRLYGYRIDPTAHIAWPAWVYPERLTMGAGAQIAALTVAIHLDRLEMGAGSYVGRSNWITGHPKPSDLHFTHRPDRDPSLLIGDHASITKSHVIDCTDRITIGSFTTIAGYSSQFISHGIDIYANRQDCKPIHIGSHCMVGSMVIVLGGASLPDRSILGAGAVLNSAFSETEVVYGGTPARALKKISPDAAYFHRTSGFVF